MNLHEFNILFIKYPKKNSKIVKQIIFHRHAYYVTLLFSTLLMLCLYSADDVTSIDITLVYYRFYYMALLHFYTMFYVIKGA